MLIVSDLFYVPIEIFQPRLSPRLQTLVWAQLLLLLQSQLCIYSDYMQMPCDGDSPHARVTCQLMLKQEMSWDLFSAHANTWNCMEVNARCGESQLIGTSG